MVSSRWGGFITFLDLQNYVARNVDDKAFAYFTLTDVKARLNLAQKECQKRLIQSNTERYTKCVYTNTVIGQKAYALPSDFIELITLERVVQGSGDTANTTPIQYITPNQKFMNPNATGCPGYYYFAKNLVNMIPVADSVYEIHLEYSYLVADMVNDNDIPDVPAEYHEYIGILATRDCLFQDERSMSPIQAKLDYFDTLFKQVAQTRNKDSSRQIVVTDGQQWNGY